MRITRNKPVLLFLLAAICFSSCKKEKDEKPPDCKIITMTADGSTYNLIYDNDRRLSQLTVMPGNLTLKYQYSGNIVTTSSTKNGIFENKTIVTNNELGFIEFIEKPTHAVKSLLRMILYPLCFILPRNRSTNP